MSRSDEREQDERERYNAEAAADYYGREQEAERDQVEAPMTHPQPPQPSPWDAIDDREEFIGGTWYLTRDYVDTARQQVEVQHAAEVRQLTASRDEADALIARYGFGKAAHEIADLRAQLTSLQQTLEHRACCGSEHDPAQGKIHGMCVICGVPWPCDYVGPSQWEGWTPTSANINALPEPLRSYIHQIEMRCDPAGETQELVLARDTIRGQEFEIEQLQQTLTAREQETCEWTDLGDGPYGRVWVRSGCGDGEGPYEKCSVEGWKVCPYCGKPLEITRLKGERA